MKLEVDPDGHIWLLLAIVPAAVENARGASDTGVPTPSRLQLEVIAPSAATVVVSAELEWSQYEELPFRHFIAGTRRGARAVEDPHTGLVSIEVFDLYLARQ
jgi:hypothetical protein